MTSSNLDLVRSIYAAWEHGDFGTTEWAHPEIEFEFADGPAPGRGSGLAGLVDGTRDFMGAWENFRIEPDEFRELDTARVLVLIHFGGRGRASGLELGEMGAKPATLFHIRDGKVTRVVNYWTRERAFDDLGLASETGSP